MIENQLLSFRKSAAPQLTLAGRATKYVRACIDGILKIAWATNGPRSRKDFLKILPRDGFCLVGRALGGDNKNPIATALPTMLNEYLDRDSAERFVIIAPTSVFEDPESNRFIERAVIRSRSDVITIDTGKGRRAATLLAFGIEPKPLTKNRFRQFCEELLSDNGWKITAYSDDREFLTAAFDETKQLLSFGLLVAANSDKKDIDKFFRTKKSKTRGTLDYILTNARPTHGQKVVVGKRKIAIVHYSLIPEFARRIHHGLRRSG